MYAGMIFYNDTWDVFYKAISSIRKSGLKLIAIDGKYRGFGDISQVISEQALGYIKLISEKYIEEKRGGWADQIEKRNVIFETVPVGEHCLVIDADEEIINIPAKNILTEDVYKVKMVNATGTEFDAVRVFRVYPDLRYKYMHSRIYRLDQHKAHKLNSGLVNADPDKFPYLPDIFGEPVRIAHNTTYRTRARKDVKKQYMLDREERGYFDKVMQNKT